MRISKDSREEEKWIDSRKTKTWWWR